MHFRKSINQKEIWLLVLSNHWHTKSCSVFSNMTWSFVSTPVTNPEQETRARRRMRRRVQKLAAESKERYAGEEDNRKIRICVFQKPKPVDENEEGSRAGKWIWQREKRSQEKTPALMDWRRWEFRYWRNRWTKVCLMSRTDRGRERKEETDWRMIRRKEGMNSITDWETGSLSRRNQTRADRRGRQMIDGKTKRM